MPEQNDHTVPTPDHREPSPSHIEQDRRAKRNRFAELGIDPYGSRVDGLISLADARALYDETADHAFKENPENDARPRVRVAGRLVLHRAMGSLVFATLRDASGDLQIAVSKKAVDPAAFKLASIADLGDLAVVEGALGTTKTGEITVWAIGSALGEGFTISCKSLAPPPGKYHGLTDPELRYRKRYVDLYTNPDVMQTMQLRIRIIDEIRAYLQQRGYLEVETPMLQSLHGGAAAKPFKTHHNALDIPLTLRIAPELYLKRLLVGGMSKVFEINRNFRNEGISPRHNPEFTMLEAYEAYGSWETMADLVEEMICTVAENVFGTLSIEHKAGATSVAPQSTENSEEADNHQDAKPAKTRKTINLERPWRRVSMVDLVEERTGWRFTKEPISDDDIARLRADYPNKDLNLNDPDLSPAEQLVEVYEKLVEPTLIDPCFVTRVPSVIIPLAKKCADDPYFADVYELAINGVEISPGYSELNDPDVQEANFRDQVGDKDEQQQVDEDFLEALKVGMPPAGGMGLGIDRLVMMLTGAESIRDVILFPLMRPQKHSE